jgi:hypothetical protein
VQRTPAAQHLPQETAGEGAKFLRVQAPASSHENFTYDAPALTCSISIVVNVLFQSSYDTIVLTRHPPKTMEINFPDSCALLLRMWRCEMRQPSGRTPRQMAQGLTPMTRPSSCIGLCCTGGRHHLSATDATGAASGRVAFDSCTRERAPRFKWNDIILAAVLGVGNLKRARLVPPGL